MLPRFASLRFNSASFLLARISAGSYSTPHTYLYSSSCEPSTRRRASSTTAADEAAAKNEEVLAQLLLTRTSFFSRTAASSHDPAASQQSCNPAAHTLQAVCAPSIALLERLTALGVLKANERAFGCSRAQCACSAKLQQAFTAWDPNLPSLAAALRLVHTAAGDSLGTCVAHYHRAYPYRARDPIVARPD